MKDYEKFTDFLEELLFCWKTMHNPDSDCNKEIAMWRNRYLSSQNVHRIFHKEYFLSIPSKHFFRKVLQKKSMKKIVKAMEKRDKEFKK